MDKDYYKHKVVKSIMAVGIISVVVGVTLSLLKLVSLAGSTVFNAVLFAMAVLSVAAIVVSILGITYSTKASRRIERAFFIASVLFFIVVIALLLLLSRYPM